MNLDAHASRLTGAQYSLCLRYIKRMIFAKHIDEKRATVCSKLTLGKTNLLLLESSHRLQDQHTHQHCLCTLAERCVHRGRWGRFWPKRRCSAAPSRASSSTPVARLRPYPDFDFDCRRSPVKHLVQPFCAAATSSFSSASRVCCIVLTMPPPAAIISMYVAPCMRISNSRAPDRRRRWRGCDNRSGRENSVALCIDCSFGRRYAARISAGISNRHNQPILDCHCPVCHCADCRMAALRCGPPSCDGIASS